MTYSVYQAINFNTYILFIEIYLRRCGYLWSDCEFFLCRIYISVCVARFSSVPGKMESNTSLNHTQYSLFIGNSIYLLDNFRFFIEPKHWWCISVFDDMSAPYLNRRSLPILCLCAFVKGSVYFSDEVVHLPVVAFNFYFLLFWNLRNTDRRIFVRLWHEKWFINIIYQIYVYIKGKKERACCSHW